MSSFLTKVLCLRLCLRNSSRSAPETVVDTSNNISEAETKVDMAMAPSELPSDNVFGMPSNESRVCTSDNDSNSPALYLASACAERDEWLGEKYLNYAIAHMLVRHTSSSGRSTVLNVRRGLLHQQYLQCLTESGEICTRA